MHDLHNRMRTAVALAPAALTTVAGRTGKVIDRQGYGGVEFLVSYGSITATNATITVVVKEGDATGTLTSVADADLLGTEALASITATTPRTSGVSKNVSKRVGYRGNKRYVQLSIASSTVTAATIISSTAVLHSAQVGPTANP